MYKKQNPDKVQQETQTEEFDHYNVFSLVLRSIYRTNPTLAETVLPYNRYMDLYWKYFALVETLKGELRVNPNIRGADGFKQLKTFN